MLAQPQSRTTFGHFTSITPSDPFYPGTTLRRGQHATRVLTGGVWSRRKALLALEPPGASLSPCPAGPTQLHLERRWGNSSASLPVRGSVLPRSLYIIIIAFAIDQHCVVTGQSNQSNLNLVQQYSSLPSNIDYTR